MSAYRKIATQGNIYMYMIGKVKVSRVPFHPQIRLCQKQGIEVY